MADSNNTSETIVETKTDVEIKTKIVKSEPKNENVNRRQSFEEDDIPDNFFDDFSNNEFMDGLNVLDSWDENQTQKLKADDKENKSLNDEAMDQGVEEEAETKDIGKMSGVEKSDQEMSDRGRYNKLNFEKEDSRAKRDNSPRRSPFRRGRSPINRRGYNRFSKSISPRRRRSRSRPTNSPRRGRFCYSPQRNRNFNHRRRDYSPYKYRSSMEKERRRSKERRKSPRPTHEKPEELRRDPAKTKLDIEKDKDKCLRYKEAKEVEKKIIVAESGLCPPGMEDMIDEINNTSFKPPEFDSLTVSFENRISSDKTIMDQNYGAFAAKAVETDRCTVKFTSSTSDLRDIIKKRLAKKDQFSSHDKSRHSPPRYSPGRQSPIRHASDNRSRYSPDNRSRYSPDNRSRYSPDNRSRSRNSPKKPRYDRDGRRPSPISEESDREVWLRDYGRSEKRRKRSPFLHELARTLCNEDSKKFDPIPKQPTFNPFNNESVSYNPSQTMDSYGLPPVFDQTQLPMLQHPLDHPPMNMPPMNNGNFPFQPDVPQSFVQQQFAIPQQSFQQFPPPPLGPFDSIPPPVVMQPEATFQSFQQAPHPFQQFGEVPTNQVAIGSGGPPPHIYTADIRQGNNSKETLSPSLQNLQQSSRNLANLKDISSKHQQQLSKLFEDKKISLSDFLTVSAKGETVPCNIQDKIKVISRCQDAIKALDTTKRSGRFFPTIISSLNENQDNKAGKWKSPLKKMTAVKFSFTVPSSKSKGNEVQYNMKKLLATINLREQVITPPPPRIQKLSSVSDSIASQVLIPEQTSIAVQDMYMQTDPYICNKCEIRKSRKFTDRATQTTNFGGLDEATQVSPSDLPAPPPPRGILKNSSYPSLSHLTAAQLREQDNLRNQNDNLNLPGQFTSMSSIARSTFDGPLDINPEFNQSSLKMRPQSFDSPHQDNLDTTFNRFNDSPSQIQNNPWSSSWKDQKPNPNISINPSLLPAWNQNPVPSTTRNQSLPANANIPPLMKPWMSILTTPPNKSSSNNNVKRGSFQRKPNNVVNIDLTK